MAAFKAKDHARLLTEQLKLTLGRTLTVVETEDSNRWPILEITKGDEKAFVKIEDQGNGDRIDAVTGNSQRFYSPHKATLLKDNRPNGIITITISDWETGESITPTVNGVAGSAVPFNTDNNTSVADLATALAGMSPILSATALGGVITVTYLASNPATISLAVTGGDGITISQVATLTPNIDMRNQLVAQVVQLGMLTLVYSKSTPTTYDLTGANLESRMRADPRQPLQQSQ